MKVYNGWVLDIEGQEYTVVGSLKIRGTQFYQLKGRHGDIKSLRRSVLLEEWDKSIFYVR